MKKHILIIIILLTAFAVRFYKLGSFPALNADEAAIGYNAYSLIETGKDEHGNTWPVHFESFGDFKPGLYFYLALPFIKLLGLTEWAVRIPGALLGVATVWLVSKLINLLFDKKNYSLFTIHYSLGEIAAFFLAISPWHIHFSRGAWEVNVSTFFITAGIYFFVKTLKNPKHINFAFCIFSFALSLYAYHSARIIIPLLGTGILIIYRKEILANIKPWLVSGLIGLILLIPLFKTLFSPAGLSRAAGVSIFSDPGVIARINEQRGRYENPSGFLARAFHNKPINYTIEFAQNWIEHYSYNFLFKSGDEIQRNKVPGMGQMYLFDLPLLVLGVILILKSKIINPKSKYLIFCWLVIAPFAAALTFQSPHALRSQNMVIPLVIISVLGFNNVIFWFKKLAGKTNVYPLYLLIIILVILFSFYKYLNNYWNRMSVEYPFSSQYGVGELVSYIQDEGDKYENIIITSRYDQPYILFLFYMNYSPEAFQKNHLLSKRDKYGFSTVTNFDKYYFQKIDYQELVKTEKNVLIAGTDEEIPDDSNIIKDIFGSNGYKYFQIVKN